VVGEAWGSDEARSGQPFVGMSGKELERMIFDAGLATESILYANLVDAHPPGNDFTHFLHRTPKRGKNADIPLGAKEVKEVWTTTKLREGLAKLEALINEVKPKLIIGTGNWPLWALTEGKANVKTTKGFKLPGGITNWRGSQLWTTPINGVSYPYLPIIHPASILRSWDLRFPTVHDLRVRARNYIRDLRSNPTPPTWGDASPVGIAAPTFNEARSFLMACYDELDSGKQVSLSTDIETKAWRYITCIGFATKSFEICIPFFFYDTEGKVLDYFSLSEEQEIWRLIKLVLEHPNVRIIGQNFAYDTMFLQRMHGIQALVSFDTMLAHHLLWPGTPKSLDYLASLYCKTHVYWKDESQEWTDGVSHQDLWTYNLKDTRKTFDIATELQSLLTTLKRQEHYDFQLAQWKLSRKMGLKGVRQDLAERRRHHLELSEIKREHEAYLLACMPPDIRYTDSGKPWFTSTMHSMKIIYTYLQIPEVKHKKTKQPTLDASAFPVIKKNAPWLTNMLDALESYRSISLFIKLFYESELTFGSRMCCSFNIGGTETFRWSSSANAFGEGGNLQTISKGN
jgi:uracil-DNA glycosylase